MKKWYLMIPTALLIAATAQANCGECEGAKKGACHGADNAACSKEKADSDAACTMEKAKCAEGKACEMKKDSQCADGKTCSAKADSKKWYNPISWF